MAAVGFRDIHKSFGSTKVLHGITLDISDGEFMVLVGPSGCGKSTLLRMLAGLEDITAGTIAIDGRVVNDLDSKDRDIAMVFQSYALYPHMTVRENMGFSLKLRKEGAKKIAEGVSRAARILNLEPFLERYPRELSGGQRQRVAMGRAIVRDPKVFLFDEPLSNLDAKLRVAMRAEIKALHQRLKTTTVYVTHDQIEAMTMGDRIVIMLDGTVQQVGAPMEIYQKPANRFVAGFIGTPPMNFLTVQLASEGTRLSLKGQGFQIPLSAEKAARLQGFAGREVLLGIRPENLLLRSAAPEGDPLRAPIEIVEAIGSDIYLHFSYAGTAMTARVEAMADIKVGQEVALYPDAERIHLFDADSGANLLYPDLWPAYIPGEVPPQGGRLVRNPGVASS
jgi:multiple sugar transport system ATP-binding protein